MKRLLIPIVLGLTLVGCSSIGESEAPKPDPSRFMPKNGTTSGPNDPPPANSK